MQRLAALVILPVISLVITVCAHATGGGQDAPGWSTPPAMAVKLVSSLNSPLQQPAFLNNLDCTQIQYRLVSHSDSRTGCFTPTSFGQINSDDGTVIYNATDEALPLLPYSGHEVLAPWSQAGVLLALDPAPITGSYISLYTAPLAVMHNQRSALGELTAKQLIAPPDLQLRGPDGQPLLINPQTLAFSDDGSWLVAENLNGSFVRVNLATLDMLPFAPAYGSLGSPALLKSAVAVSRDGRYVAISNEAAGALKVYDLTTCNTNPPVNLTPLSCKSYDYRSFIAQQTGGAQAIRHVRFINDGLISFEAITNNGASDKIYELAPAGSINSLIDYLGMGDSYTSGEGAFDYLDGTDSGNNMCHLSLTSYPLLLTHDLFGAQGGHSVACSGAEISDVGDMSAGYRGQVKGVLSWQQLQTADQSLLSSVMGNFMPGYVAQQRFVQQYQPGLGTVSIGGDDVGFGDILQECVTPKISLHHSAHDCFGTYEDRLELKNLVDRTVPRWAKLYQGLQAAAPGMRLYAIGYPQIASDRGNCALNVHLSQGELEFTAEIIDYLDGDIKQAAAKAGIPYVDISQALVGHRLCEAAGYDVAVTGLTAGTDAGVFGVKVFGKESYHPNALGQQLIEQSILKQSNNFAKTAVSGTVPPDDRLLLNAHKTGRTVYTRVPGPSLTSSVIKTGQSTMISIAGNKAGLEANSSYSVHLDGPDGPPIATLASNGAGDVNGSVTVPAGTASGGHTIDITGTNKAGEPVDVTTSLYIPVDGSDSDADGIPDDSDSCPRIINSGADGDHDGIDDACDPALGPPPTATSSGHSSQDPSWGNSSGSSQTSLKRQAVTTTAPGKGTARTIAGAALSPAKVKLKNFNMSESKREVPPLLRFPKLNVFNWWLWLALPFFAWWFIILIYLCFQRFTRRENEYQNDGLSTTISS